MATEGKEAMTSPREIIDRIKEPSVIEDADFTVGVDGCFHGVGFDEECEACDDEEPAL